MYRRTPDRYVSTYQNTGDDLLNHFYLQLYRTTNSYYANTGLDVTLSEFKSRFALFSFCNTTNLRHDPNLIPLVKSGSARLIIKFKHPTDNYPLQTCYWAAFYPTILGIDKERKVTTSFRTS